MRPETVLDPRPAPSTAPRPAVPPRPAPLTVVGRDVALLVNGNASGADGVAERATAELRAAGAHVHARVTASEAELAAAVREAGDRRVVLVGGDGTVHAYANLDLPGLPPAALLPAGRANNIARALGIAVEWPAAAQLAVRGRAADVDLLRVETPQRTLFAVEGVSAGFHAAARHRYAGTNSADLAAGVRALVAELGAFRPHPVALRADGAPLFAGPAAQVFLSNLPYFGFGFHVDPVADPSDGRLEAIVLEAATRRDVVRMLAAARDGRHLGRAGVTWGRAVRVHLERPVPLVADAQPLGVTTAVVTVAAGRLRLVAPEVRA
ncbi:MAG TPA: diacylglycerol kinase family protein [Solirubrobacteraceae bacterium]|nr:diacylglycerol kinase family protein [Solirubrobacteraceae bacterium]